jgi:vacuolar-type H+-ATPase subunit F/Vma7
MGVLAAIGEAVLVEGFALAGATVLVADDPDTVRRQWAVLPVETSVVILTQKAANALADAGIDPDGVLTATMPS